MLKIMNADRFRLGSFGSFFALGFFFLPPLPAGLDLALPLGFFLGRASSSESASLPDSDPL